MSTEKWWQWPWPMPNLPKMDFANMPTMSFTDYMEYLHKTQPSTFEEFLKEVESKGKTKRGETQQLF